MQELSAIILAGSLILLVLAPGLSLARKKQ